MTTQRRRKSTITDRARERLLVAAHALRAAESEGSRGAIWTARDLRDRVIREEYLAGVNTHDIVALLKEGGVAISRQQVIHIHSNVERPPLFDVTEATERYRRGESLRDLGRAYGCSGNFIKKALAAAGVEIRGREEARRVHYAKDGAP